MSEVRQTAVSYYRKSWRLLSLDLFRLFWTLTLNVWNMEVTCPLGAQSTGKFLYSANCLPLFSRLLLYVTCLNTAWKTVTQTKRKGTAVAATTRYITIQWVIKKLVNDLSITKHEDSSLSQQKWAKAAGWMRLCPVPHEWRESAFEWLMKTIPAGTSLA